MNVCLASELVVSLPCTPLSLVERLTVSAVILLVIGLAASIGDEALVIVAERMQEALRYDSWRGRATRFRKVL